MTGRHTGIVSHIYADTNYGEITAPGFGPQALLPGQYARLMEDLRRLADVLGKSIPP